MDKQNGFSLIEVIVTTAVAAVVLSASTPYFQLPPRNIHQTIASNGMTTAVRPAHSGTVSHSHQVPATLCKSPNTGCITDSGPGNGSWGRAELTNPDVINNATMHCNPQNNPEACQAQGLAYMATAPTFIPSREKTVSTRFFTTIIQTLHQTPKIYATPEKIV